ncbi:MAG: hypothetical protein A2Z77_00480 [Chloroflexi bacterium RBG_13_51_36]|nr:MAG: hypothetical protein A2Z77_00480 [Chloroflexi bacterium RBG_13_51_36]
MLGCIAARYMNKPGYTTPECGYIPLTQGKWAIVSLEDYDFLGQFNWHYAHGYARRNVGKHGSQSIVRMHRIVLERMGFKDFKETDHINRDRADNRRSNLRPATTTENQRNVGPRCDSTSGFRGVCWNKQYDKWQVYINVNGKRIFLGYFDDKQDAISARLSAEQTYFGEFASA